MGKKLIFFEKIDIVIGIVGSVVTLILGIPLIFDVNFYIAKI